MYVHDLYMYMYIHVSVYVHVLYISDPNTFQHFAGTHQLPCSVFSTRAKHTKLSVMFAIKDTSIRLAGQIITCIYVYYTLVAITTNVDMIAQPEGEIN